MTRIVLVAQLLLVSACGSGDSNPTTESGVVSVQGTVGLAVESGLPATLSVGLVSGTAQVPTRCGDLRYADSAEVSEIGEFPISFATELVPPGDYQVTALLVDPARPGLATDAWEDVTITATGDIVRRLDGATLTAVSLTLTGGRDYACP